MYARIANSSITNAASVQKHSSLIAFLEATAIGKLGSHVWTSCFAPLLRPCNASIRTYRAVAITSAAVRCGVAGYAVHTNSQPRMPSQWFIGLNWCLGIQEGGEAAKAMLKPWPEHVIMLFDFAHLKAQKLAEKECLRYKKTDKIKLP